MNARISLIVLFLSFCFLAGLGLSSIPGPYGDNGRYIVLAKSLLEGKGFRQINFLNEPFETKIPPLYPAVLAILIFIFGYKIIILKIFSLILMVSALFFFYLYLRKIKVSQTVALIVMLLLCSSPHTLEYSREVLSETPFVFFIALTTFFIAGYEEEGRKSSLYFAVLSSFSASFVRDVGILLLVAIAVMLLKHKEYKRCLIVVTFILILAGSWLYKNLYFQEGYLNEFITQGNYLVPSKQMLGFGQFLRRYFYESCAYVGDIIPDYVLAAYRAVVPHGRFWLIKIISGILIFSVIAYGLLLFRKKYKSDFLLLFVSFYGLCLPLFSSYGIRYIIPIGFFLFLGLVFEVTQISLIRNKKIAVSLLVLVLFFNLQTEAKHIAYIRQGYPGEWGNFYKALTYLKENTDQKESVMCIKQFLAYLLSERKTVGYPRIADTEEMFEYIRSSPASYVLIDSLEIVNNFFSKKYLLPVIKKHAASFRLVYQSQDPLTYVYQIIR